MLPEGRRILFVIPWGERVILGTTDTDYSGDPADVRTDAADIRYILGVVNDAFPEARLTPADLISSWAGVRPLIASGATKAGAPSDISRSHQIRVAEPGWIDVAGGKLTTYRLMAEQTVDQVGRFLNPKPPRSRTAHSPLAAPPGSGILPPPFEFEVVRQCCREESAVHLDDVLLRRTSWHFYHPNHAELAGAVCEWMAAELGWNSERKHSERERYFRVAEFVKEGIPIMSCARLAASLFVIAAAALGQPSRAVLLVSVDGLRPDYVTAADRHGLKILVPAAADARGRARKHRSRRAAHFHLPEPHHARHRHNARQTRHLLEPSLRSVRPQPE